MFIVVSMVTSPKEMLISGPSPTEKGAQLEYSHSRLHYLSLSRNGRQVDENGQGDDMLRILSMTGVLFLKTRRPRVQAVTA